MEYEVLVGRVYRALKSYNMSNMVMDDQPDCPYPLIDLCSIPGTSIETGEEELWYLAQHIADNIRNEDKQT